MSVVTQGVVSVGVAIVGVVSSIISAARSYLELNGVNSYISIPDKVLSGDFTIEYCVYLSEDPTTDVHLGNYSASTVFIGNVANNGTFRVRLDGTNNYDSTTGVIYTGESLRVVITRAADALLVTVNDVDVIDIESGVYTGDVTISAIGTYNSLLFPANCYMFDVGLCDSTGTDDRFYAIDDGWSSNPTITDSISGQDGTAVNVQEADWSTELS